MGIWWLAEGRQLADKSGHQMALWDTKHQDDASTGQGVRGLRFEEWLSHRSSQNLRLFAPQKSALERRWYPARKRVHAVGNSANEVSLQHLAPWVQIPPLTVDKSLHLLETPSPLLQPHGVVVSSLGVGFSGNYPNSSPQVLWSVGIWDWPEPSLSAYGREAEGRRSSCTPTAGVTGWVLPKSHGGPSGGPGTL